MTSIKPSTNDPQLKSADWWVELFPPLCLNASNESLFTEEKLFKTHDVESNIYKRVWLQMQAEEEREARLLRHEQYAQAQQPLSQKEKVMTVEDKNVAPKKENDNKAESIWSLEELAVIRGVIAELKTERGKLRALVKAQSERMEMLERKCRSNHKELCTLRTRYQEVLVANERFQLLSAVQTATVTDGEERISQHEHLMQRLNEENFSLRNQLEKSNRALQHCKTKEEELRIKQEVETDTVERRVARAVENAVSKCNNEIAELRKALLLSQKETRIEKEKCLATNKGFQQLLRHYTHQHVKDHGPDLLAEQLQLF